MGTGTFQPISPPPELKHRCRVGQATLENQKFHWRLDKKSRMGCKSPPAIHALLTRLEALYFDTWRFFLASLKALKALRRIDLWNRVRTLASATPNLKGRNAFNLDCHVFRVFKNIFLQNIPIPKFETYSYGHYVLYSYARSLYIWLWTSQPSRIWLWTLQIWSTMDSTLSFRILVTYHHASRFQTGFHFVFSDVINLAVSSMGLLGSGIIEQEPQIIPKYSFELKMISGDHKK